MARTLRSYAVRGLRRALRGGIRRVTKGRKMESAFLALGLSSVGVSAVIGGAVQALE